MSIRFFVQSFIVKFVSAFLLFVMFIALSRVLGPVEYGFYSALLGCSTIMTFIALGGQNSIVLRAISAFSDDDNAGKAHWYLRWSSMTVICGNIMVFVGALVLEFLLGGSGSSFSNLFFIWSALLVIPLSAAEYLMSLLRARGRILLALLPRDILWRVAVIGFVCCVSILVQTSLTGLQAHLISIFVLTILVATQIYLTWLSLRNDLLRTTPAPDLQNWMKASFWTWISSVAGMMVSQLSPVIVFATVGAAEAGAFFAADRISMLVSLTLISVNMVAAPRFARLIQLNRQSDLQQSCQRISAVLAPLTFICFSIIHSLDIFLLGLFDPTFASASFVLVFLLAGQSFNVLSGSSADLMLMGGGERHLAIMLGLTQSFGLILIWLLTIKFGIIGSAIGAFLANAAWNVWSIVWCRRRLGVDPSILGLLWQPEIRQN